MEVCIGCGPGMAMALMVSSACMDGCFESSFDFDSHARFWKAAQTREASLVPLTFEWKRILLGV